MKITKSATLHTGSLTWGEIVMVAEAHGIPPHARPTLYAHRHIDARDHDPERIVFSWEEGE